jgi:hypothetical protein
MVYEEIQLEYLYLCETFYRPNCACFCMTLCLRAYLFKGMRNGSISQLHSKGGFDVWIPCNRLYTVMAPSAKESLMKPFGNCLCTPSTDCVKYLKSSLRTTRRAHVALARISLCCVITLITVMRVCLNLYCGARMNLNAMLCLKETR